MNSTCQAVTERILKHAHNQSTLTPQELSVWTAQRRMEAEHYLQLLLLESWLASHPIAGVSNATSTGKSSNS